MHRDSGGCTTARRCPESLDRYTPFTRIKVMAVRLSSRPTITLQMAHWSGGSDSVACSTMTTEKPRESGTIQ